MATVKKGMLTRPPQWWKHLRDWKRVFWKRERQAEKKRVRTACGVRAGSSRVRESE